MMSRSALKAYWGDAWKNLEYSFSSRDKLGEKPWVLDEEVEGCREGGREVLIKCEELEEPVATSSEEARRLGRSRSRAVDVDLTETCPTAESHGN